jgi:hypothetical protein
MAGSTGRPKARGKVMRPEDTHVEGAPSAADKQREEVADQQLEAQERNLTNLPPAPDEHREVDAKSPAGSEKKRGITVDRLPNGDVIVDTHGAVLLSTAEEKAEAQRAFGQIGAI